MEHWSDDGEQQIGYLMREQQMPNPCKKKEVILSNTVYYLRFILKYIYFRMFYTHFNLQYTLYNLKYKMYFKKYYWFTITTQI